MAFIISDDFYKFTMPIEVRDPDGNKIGDFVAGYRQIESDEFKRLADEGNESLLRRILTSISGIKSAADGPDLSIEEAVKMVANIPVLATAVLGGYAAGNEASFQQGKKKSK